ncbi:MAG: sulfotransferase family 2 domain-containing protein [Leptospirales bacterium]
MKTKFVLFSIQRTGSTFLAELLSSHPSVLMAKEIFKANGEGYNVDNFNYRFVKKNVSPADYLKSFYTNGALAHTTTGFKLMLDQAIIFKNVMDYIRQNKIKIIVLTRNNVFDIYLSRIIARTEKIWHITTETEVQGNNTAPVYLEPVTLVNELKNIESELVELEEIRQLENSLMITYNDLVYKTKQTLNTVEDFLNIEHFDSYTANIKKISNMNSRNLIQNYDEIENTLQSGPYEKYLVPMSGKASKFKEFNHRYKIIFIHIPKNAGTSIENALFGTYGKVGHHKAISYYQEDSEKFKQYLKFAVVRNPFDRIISAFRYLKNGGRNKFDSEWAKIHLSKYKNFSDFINALDEKKIQDEILSWKHFEPQYKYVYDENGNCLVDYIIYFENLDEELLKISNAAGINPLSIQKLNKGMRKPNFKKFYSTRNIETISRVYKKDLELFHYKFN